MIAIQDEESSASPSLQVCQSGVPIAFGKIKILIDQNVFD